MTGPFENIVQHLFHQPSLQSVTIDEVQRLAMQHPSFAAAQYLLLKKMQETAHPGFDDQLHKTTLYFNNPLWLQFLLVPRQETAIHSRVADHQHSAPANKEDKPEHNGIGEIEADMPAPSPQVTPEGKEMETEQETIAGATEEPSAAPIPHLPGTATFWAEENGMEEPREETAMAVPTITNMPDIVEIPSAFSEENDQKKEPLPMETEVADQTVQALQEEAPEEEIRAVQSSMESSIASVVRKVKEDEQKIIIETPAAMSDQLFEPYHTIDYFASQGIKLDKIEPEPQDKLGKQLKSFTEWLKGMKKLQQVSVEKVLAENDESEVVAAAIHSVEDKEVITESMALVLEKQGLNEKAAEIYRKLSLLNPGKSAYFAARIDALKK